MVNRASGKQSVSKKSVTRSKSGKHPLGDRAKPRPLPQARQWDLHALYETAVQDADVDAEFIRRTYKKLRGRPPLVLREDFCGTAALCATWVKQNPACRAYGLDLDERTLNWGIGKHIVPLGKRAAQVVLIKQDVRQPADFKADVTVAFNFSYMYFKQREELREYFRSVRQGLKPAGIFYLDIYGGPEAMEPREERTKFDEFEYVWDQAAVNPITHEVTNYIHFEFPDGSRRQRAFTYNWRLWTIPEVREIALEAGFKDCVVYWEGTDRATGEGNGIYRASLKGDNAPAFVCYILCVK
jgi:SAM-dependent methyltransferase